MKVLVIGATGHIGTYLIPRLVGLGHEVVAVSRGKSEPYHDNPAWKRVTNLCLDRIEEEKKGTFGNRIAEVGADAIIDLIVFNPQSMEQLVEKIIGRVDHYIYCGSMWVYGPTEIAPTTEKNDRLPFGPYGKKKAEIESRLLELSAAGKLNATTLHPGHIVGPGWIPVGPTGNLDLEVIRKLAHGEKVMLPDFGLASLHHVHADDVAQAFELALERPEDSIGESFNVIAPFAVTLRGLCREIASWFGQEPDIDLLPWPQWKETVSKQDADETWEHIRHSPFGSIEKAKTQLGYRPMYNTFDAIRESLKWLMDSGQLDLSFPEPNPAKR